MDPYTRKMFLVPDLGRDMIQFFNIILGQVRQQSWNIAPLKKKITRLLRIRFIQIMYYHLCRWNILEVTSWEEGLDLVILSSANARRWSTCVENLTKRWQSWDTTLRWWTPSSLEDTWRMTTPEPRYWLMYRQYPPFQRTLIPSPPLLRWGYIQLEGEMN